VRFASPLLPYFYIKSKKGTQQAGHFKIKNSMKMKISPKIPTRAAEWQACLGIADGGLIFSITRAIGPQTAV
jgi:hypothetical protein